MRSQKTQIYYHHEPMQHQSHLLKKLQQNIQDLSEQLQISNDRNMELTKLIEILTNQRNFYSQELKKSDILRHAMQDQLRRVKIQSDSKATLANQLKKANRQLSEQLQTLTDNLEQSKFMFDAQEQQINRIRKQKQLIEKQWNRVLKQLNKKMTKLHHKQEQQQKQNMEMFSNLPLKEKVKNALNKINRELKEQENNATAFYWKKGSQDESRESSTSGNQMGDFSLE